MIKINCPTCGAVLNLEHQSGIENKFFTCPVCRKRHLIGSCKKVEEPKPEPKPLQNDNARDNDKGYYSERTCYQGENDGGTVIDGSGNPTEIRPHFQLIGRLVVESSGEVFNLRPGINLIGRKSDDSKADFKIACSDKRMSREHIQIEVKRGNGGGFVHFLSLYREKVNPTHFGNNLMEPGDVYVLNDKDEISLPGEKLRFEIS